MRARTRRPEALLVAVAVVEIGWIATRGHVSGVLAWIPLVAAIAGHAWLLDAERRSPRISGRQVVAAVVAVAVAAVVVRPTGSHDLYQYAFYGRMAGRLGADPYALGPDAFPHDPLYASLAPGWHGARSVYGPVFTWFSALGAHVFGTSVLGARLWFQGAAGLALVTAAHKLQRDVGVAAALAVGLSPVLVAAVNGGHNDLLVGVLVLLAIGPGARRHPVLAGAVLGIATCVKLSAAPVVLAVAVVAVHRRAGRLAVRAAAGWVAVTVGAYALGGGWHLLEPVKAVGGRTSRASGWALVERMAGATAFGHGLLALAAAVAGVLVLVVAWRWRAAPVAAVATAAGTAACFAAPYVLGWYPAAVLPLSGRVVGRRAATILQVGASALLLAYVVPAGTSPAAVPLAPVAGIGCGLVLVVLVVVLVGWPSERAGYRLGGGRPRTAARRRGRLSGVPAPRGLARAGRPGEASGLPRRGLLGAARPWLR